MSGTATTQSTRPWRIACGWFGAVYLLAGAASATLAAASTDPRPLHLPVDGPRSAAIGAVGAIAVLAGRSGRALKLALLTVGVGALAILALIGMVGSR